MNLFSKLEFLLVNYEKALTSDQSDTWEQSLRAEDTLMKFIFEHWERFQSDMVSGPAGLSFRSVLSS